MVWGGDSELRGWLQSPKLDITGGTLGQEGGVERDGETCVG